LQHALGDILPNPAARRMAGQNIKSYVAGNYGWEVIVESYKSLYARLLTVERK
jgi:hypothetical protein